ncbi:type-F conjugative transfer system protein TraW [Roseateles chitinivorans]|uniref:type-F conjugative transfer system protein TraW n=1 Tax=Roseateles chitinivorans TaxID=2917965 RepID=UPI003D67546C
MKRTSRSHHQPTVPSEGAPRAAAHTVARTAVPAAVLAATFAAIRFGLSPAIPATLATCAITAITAIALPVAPAMAAEAAAPDAGTLGPTYPITEAHLLQMIEQRLREAARTGELSRIEDEARSRGAHAVRHPTPVAEIVTTRVARSFLFDPTFVLGRNVLGPRGELLFPAGTKKNPLDVTSLSRPLLFFDARDSRQVRQAHTVITQHQGRVKPILTAGSYLELMHVWRTPVYYDQGGMLTRRLGIRQVPAMVTQQGQRLRVDELEVAP